MAIDLKPAVAQRVASRLGSLASKAEHIQGRAGSLWDEAMLDGHGVATAKFIGTTAHKLESLSKLVDLYARRVETTDAKLASQLDAKLKAALSAFYASNIRAGASNSQVAHPRPGEKMEDYLARVAGAATEERLRRQKLLSGPTTKYYTQWLVNAARNGVHPDEIAKIAERFNISPSDFKVLEELVCVTDNDGKSFFKLSPTATPEEVKKAVLMTYLVNAGTGYGSAEGHQHNDFPATPFSADEVARITKRIELNGWSYRRGSLTSVPQIHATGGVVYTTPNGIMIAIRGTRFHFPPVGADVSIARGGTTFGDLFTLPERSDVPDAEMIKRLQSGYAGEIKNIDTDRLLHHEEIHSQQWAALGEIDFPSIYLMLEAERMRRGMLSRDEQEKQARAAGLTVDQWLLNAFEYNAGDHDGGYTP